MIEIQLMKEDGYTTTVEVIGHSTYAENGKDIVCAAISALSITLVMTAERYYKDHISYTTNSGQLRLKVHNLKVLKDLQILFDYYELGVKAIAEQYPQHVSFTYQTL